MHRSYSCFILQKKHTSKSNLYSNDGTSVKVQLDVISQTLQTSSMDTSRTRRPLHKPCKEEAQALIKLSACNV